MLTRRKKQNILYLCIGVVIGMAIAAAVAYFGVIANFTRESIVKIQNVLPVYSDTTNTVDTNTESLKENLANNQLSQHADSIDITRENVVFDTVKTIRIERDTVLPFEPTITIKTDIKVAATIIPIKYQIDDTSNIPLRKGEMTVELWENPTNFTGYRKYQNKLIVYGIDIENISFLMASDSLFLIYNNKRLHLKDSDNFLRYPAGFVK